MMKMKENKNEKNQCIRIKKNERKQETCEDSFSDIFLKLVKDMHPIQTQRQNLTQYLSNVQVKKAKQKNDKRKWRQEKSSNSKIGI